MGSDHNARMRQLATERGGATLVGLDAERRCFVVPSKTVGGRNYQVSVEGAGGFAYVRCNCPAGARQAPLGSVPCHHGAAGCLAMEEAGLLAWTGDAWLVVPQPTAVG